MNLSFVVNVIERAKERADALRVAWRLAQRMLVVAARLEWEACSFSGRAQADGFVTAKDKFQKLYRQDELRAWIDERRAHGRSLRPGGVYFSDQPSAFARR